MAVGNFLATQGGLAQGLAISIVNPNACVIWLPRVPRWLSKVIELFKKSRGIHSWISTYLVSSGVNSVRILVWSVPLAQVLPHPQLIFPSKTWFLGIYLSFQQQKSLKNQYLRNFQLRYKSIFKNFCTTSSKRHGLKPMHPSWLRAFQRHQEHDLKHPGSVHLMTTKQNKLPSFIVPSFIDRINFLCL